MNVVRLCLFWLPCPDILSTKHGQLSGSAYALSELPCVLLEILCHPEVLPSSSSEEFKTDRSYGNALLSLLGKCLHLLVGSIREPDSARCGKRVVSYADRFSPAMWSRRHLISILVPNKLDDYLLGPPEVLKSCHSSVVSMIELYKAHRKCLPLLKTRAGSFLVYFWAYSTQYEDCDTALHLLFDMMNADAPNVPVEFVHHVVFCHRSFPRHLAVKMSLFFRLERIIDEPAERMICLFIVFMKSEIELFRSALRTSDENGLITSLIWGCQRQLCCSRTSTAQSFVVMTMQGLHMLFGNDETGRQARQEFILNSGSFNFIAILSYALILAVQENVPVELDMATQLLAIHQTLVRARGNCDETEWTQYLESTIHTTSRRVWHYTLRKILAIHTAGSEHTRLKLRALKAWRHYGALCGLKEGVNTVDFHGPSEPSSVPLYWRIPKRCFWNGCACAGHLGAHRVRVCRGCFRVLYCNQMCQARDWEAGHRLVCKSLS
ncbi:hypothetical protein BXZ70DRAFT_947938 [Cristinia sonorae]|uniref:MYND-type domain-containing protein n=1 Tax=Cristinia sonorae TaxID=1940300 RepID=A0A8K0UKJ6_9AGAR|nr:hypothetical protein BXZ70DRAFT_947938 [Cristinia sonorae]